MNNSSARKRTAWAVVIAIIVIVAGVSYVRLNKQSSTSDVVWKTYVNKDFGFKFSYPDTWTFADNSATTTDGIRYASILFQSRMRSDLAGYTGLPVYYVLSISNGAGDHTLLQTIGDFGTPNGSHQSAWNANVDRVTELASPEHAIAQKILDSFICANGATNYPHCNADASMKYIINKYNQ